MGLQENYLEYRNHINTLKTDQGYIKYILKIQQGRASTAVGILYE